MCNRPNVKLIGDYWGGGSGLVLNIKLCRSVFTSCFSGGVGCGIVGKAEATAWTASAGPVMEDGLKHYLQVGNSLLCTAVQR